MVGESTSMRERSGVMVLEAAVACCGFSDPIELLLVWKEGVVGLGVDQENAAGFGWEFREDWDVAVAGAASQPESI